MATGPAVSVLVVNRDRADLLAACLESVDRAAARLGDERVEVIVVDNGSSDGSAEMVARDFPAVRLVGFERNEGFAGAVEHARRIAAADWLLTINNDATIAEDAIARMFATARSAPADVAGIAALMRFAHAPDVINSAGVGVDRLGIAYDLLLGRPVEEAGTEVTEVFGASAGAALYRAAALEAIGGFEPSFFAYLEDVDVAWRARAAGRRFLLEPRAHVVHHHSATSRHGSPFKYRLVGRNRVRLLARNATRRQLLRYGIGMVAYDLAYCLVTAVSDRTLAPVAGRVAGLRGWSRDRAAAEPTRRAVALEPVRGVRAAITRRAAWRKGGL